MRTFHVTFCTSKLNLHLFYNSEKKTFEFEIAPILFLFGFLFVSVSSAGKELNQRSSKKNHKTIIELRKQQQQQRQLQQKQ